MSDEVMTPQYGRSTDSKPVEQPVTENKEPTTEAHSAGESKPDREYVEVEAAGAVWRVHKPHQAAMAATSFGLSEYAPERVQVNTMTRFFANHMHPDDLNTLFDRMSDPDDVQMGQGLDGFMGLFEAIGKIAHQDG